MKRSVAGAKFRGAHHNLYFLRRTLCPHPGLAMMIKMITFFVLIWWCCGDDIDLYHQQRWRRRHSGTRPTAGQHDQHDRHGRRQGELPDQPRHQRPPDCHRLLCHKVGSCFAKKTTKDSTSAICFLLALLHLKLRAQMRRRRRQGGSAGFDIPTAPPFEARTDLWRIWDFKMYTSVSFVKPWFPTIPPRTSV